MLNNVRGYRREGIFICSYEIFFHYLRIKNEPTLVSPRETRICTKRSKQNIARKEGEREREIEGEKRRAGKKEWNITRWYFLKSRNADIILNKRDWLKRDWANVEIPFALIKILNSSRAKFLKFTLLRGS